MSDIKNDKHIGYELLSMAVFLGGAFCAASVGMAMFSEPGASGNLSTTAMYAIINSLGEGATMALSIGCIVLGGSMFLRPSILPLSLPMSLLTGGGIALSLLLGAFGAELGGSLGGLLPGALGSIGGGIVNAVLALGVTFLGAWLAIGAPLPQKRKKVVEFNPVATALSEVDTDGVSEAEAEALFPEPPTPLAAAPGVTEYEQRARGELPAGVRPLGDPTPEDYGSSKSESNHSATTGPTGSAERSSEPQPLGADLVDAESTNDSRTIKGHLEGAVWTRTEGESQPEVRPLEGGVTALEPGSAPSSPSWEAAEEEDELEEDAAAELDDEDSEEEEDVEYEEEDEYEEDAAAELDDEDSEEEEDAEYEEEDELEEDAAAELVGQATESSLEDGDEIVADLDEDSESMPRAAWEQPGLFDSVESAAEPARIEVAEKSLVEMDREDETATPSGDPSMAAEGEEDLELLRETAAAEALALKEAKVADEAAAAEPAAAEPEFVLPSQEAAAEEVEPVAEVAGDARESEPVVELSHDEKVYRCGALFLDQGRVAVSMLQRNFEMGFQEATAILDELQEMGLIGPYLGGTRRDILMTLEEWEALGAAR